MARKFGIIGHGFMGHEHESMLTDFEGIQVVAICDIDPSQLGDVKEGIKTYEKATDLINDPDVEVVLIAANNNQHKKLVIEAAEAGKQVICEKPVALSLEDLDEMEAACKKAGVTFTVHHQRRYDIDFRTAKNVFDSGELGDLYVVKSALYTGLRECPQRHQQGSGRLFPHHASFRQRPCGRDRTRNLLS